MSKPDAPNKPTRPKRTPAAINLEQSEAQRQRALGAQTALREELDTTKATLADREQRLTAESHRLATAVEQLKAMERRNAELVKELEGTKQQLHTDQMRLSEREGRLAMLERLGTIPEAKPQDFDGLGYPTRPTYGVRG